LSAEFFAPTTATSPASRAPPNTLNRSTGGSLDNPLMITSILQLWWVTKIPNQGELWHHNCKIDAGARRGRCAPAL